MRIPAKNRPLFLIGLLLASALALAEPPMVFQNLGSQEGLPQNTVMQTLQDVQGFIWVATEDGLVRYDGYEIRRYEHAPGQNDSLPGNFVFAMAEDPGGNLWLALKDAGLARWNRQTDRFTSFRHDPAKPAGLSSDAVRTLMIDRRGHLWIGTTGGGLNEFDPATGVFRQYVYDAARAGSLSSNVVTSVWEEPNGQIWVGTDDGLNRLLPESHTFRRFGFEPGNAHSLSSNHISVIRTDQRGRLWIGTFDAGLNLFERTSETFSSYRARTGDDASLASDEVRALLDEPDGRFWVGTSEGLNLRDERTSRFARYVRDVGDPSSLPDNYVMSLFQDRSGLLWVGTRAGGVSRWSPRTWSLGHQRPAALGGSYVMSFAEDPGGRLWLGTLGNGVVRCDPVSRACSTFEDVAGRGRRLSDSRVMALAMDQNGDLWIGTKAGGLSRLSASGRLDTWRAEPTNPTALGTDGIMAILLHSDGRIWLGTFGAGVNVLDPVSGRFQRVTHDTLNAHSLSSPRATALAQDRDGNVWVGTDGGGLDLLRPDGSVVAVFEHHPDSDASLSANTVYAVHVDPSGRVWVGTAGGGLDLVLGSAAHPDSIQFKHASQREGLTSDVIYGIESDGEGGLWLSGNAGLMRYDPLTRAVRPFHREHGLQGEEFNFGAHYRTRAGLLAFGGPNGYNLFEPARVLEQSAPPAVVLTNVEVRNKPLATARPYPLLDRLELSADESDVAFEFAALDFAAPAKNRYAYRLRGFDPDWVTPRQRRTVSYTNLSAGRYVFEVKAATGYGVWGPVALSLPVVVAPAPWRTWWAYVIYAAFACLLLYQWHRLQRRKLAQVAEAGRRLEAQVADRTNELRERNAELDRVNRIKSDFMARMSHEIRSPMNGVIGTLELLQRSQLSAQHAKLTTIARTSAQSLLRILNDILDLAKVESGKLVLETLPFDLVAVIEDTAQLLAPQASAKRLELIVSAAPGLDRLLLGDALRIQQILINLIGNAIKFTDRGEVAVRAAVSAATPSEAEITITVSDTGIGMTAETLGRAFEPFAQADESTTRRFGGTGLGLAICRELAALMGASISAQSEPNRGSVFTLQIRLPCADPIVQADQRCFTGLRALVASRRPTLIEAIAAMARRWSLLTEPLAPGVEPASHLANAAGNVGVPPIDAVIFDAESFDEQLEVMLPALLKPAMPPSVVLCAANPELRARLEAISASMTLVSKPVRHADLHEALARALGRSALPVVPAVPPAQERLQANVLVAEDNPVNQTVAEGFLLQMGCSVTCVADGRLAVTRASSGAFDLILMDLQMPNLDGIEATALIRKAEAAVGARRSPIIAVTANASATHREICLAAGMDDFLGKPFYFDDLRQVLLRWLPEHVLAALPRPARKLAAVPEAQPLSLDAEMVAGIRAASRPGEGSLFNRLVALFVTSSRRQLEQLHLALDAGDLRAAAAASHALKGGAGNLGAIALAAVAGELNRACAAGDSTRIAGLLLDLERLHPTAIAALEAEALKESA